MLLKRSLLLIFACLMKVACFAAGTTFNVSYSAETFAGPFTGKVVVYLTKAWEEPRMGPDWFHPGPIAVVPFASVTAGQTMVVNASSDESVPGRLKRLSGHYWVQAVLDRNLGGRAVGTCPGNLYSKAIEVDLDPNLDKPITLVCDKAIETPSFTETEHVKFVRIPSKLLSDFYKRPMYIEAAVGLPDDWASDPKRKYPVIYEVPGFGGTPAWYDGAASLAGSNRNGESFITVFLNADCPTGHSVFADSDNNGPWGKALTTEFIPELEKRYRGIGARYATGHSSGGWSSLWLQVTYPDVFDGCWSTSPDPVDFRSFQAINLYEPNANLYFDAKGKPRPIARFGDDVVMTAKAFCDRERGLRGEQMGSFEAVFGSKGLVKLWSRDTGAIDPAEAKVWKRYDIGFILRTQWPALGPKLKGKIFVACGTEDTFYLDTAVRLLKKDLKDLGSDATVLLLPGDHGTVLTPSLMSRIDREMALKFNAWKARKGVK